MKLNFHRRHTLRHDADIVAPLVTVLLRNSTTPLLEELQTTRCVRRYPHLVWPVFTFPTRDAAGRMELNLLPIFTLFSPDPRY